ncbi:hypothetical protein ACFPLB_08565 [Aquamicrobium segne]|uniref:Lysis protein n=1 Tax=Aquamicrobium segne TaxID=469547 RepID=A0ABW0GWH4_9HYPH
MRYVIVIMIITCFLIWDGLYNGGHYINAGVKTLNNMVRMVTG